MLDRLECPTLWNVISVGIFCSLEMFYSLECSIRCQDRSDDKDVVDFVCGVAYGSKPMSGGDSQWFTLKVDKELCPNDVLFSMAGMLGGLSYC